jgi:hypothetical protein
MDDFEITKRLFIHHFLNPPTPGLGGNFNLNLTNPNGAMMLTKAQSDGRTYMLLEVKSALGVGFTSTEQNILESEIRNLVLGFNLNLELVCISDAYVEYQPTAVKFKPSEPEVTSNQQVGSITQSVTDPLFIHETTHVVMGCYDTVDEQNVIDAFRKIQRFRQNIQSTSPIAEVNVDRALREFELGMSPMNTISKFKHIYNAVEIATNLNGESWMECSKLDAEICKLAENQLQQALVKQWRLFYNRAKHSDRAKMDNADTQTYNQGMNNLPAWLPEIRTCAVTILLKRLS